MQLELRGITKRFTGVIANDSVDLTVAEGELVALLGENGAGKSTLMNVLYGLYSADEGEILIDGEPLTLGSPAESIAAGIGMVHQNFMLVPVFTVAENVILGIEPTNSIGGIRRRAAEQSVRELSQLYGFDLDPSAIVEDLPIGVQQRVEIIKVLARDARFLVLDEPTAVLTPQEVDDLFEIIRQLKAAGKGIVFISHKLKEALAIADRIVVMRQGKTVAEVDPSETTEQDLATLMVGRPVELVVHKEPQTVGEVVINVTGLAMTVKYVLPELRKTEGRLVLIGSVAAFLPNPMVGAYGASKAAVHNIGETLQVELKGSGVSCTTIHPGFVDSNITRVDNNGVFNPDAKDPRPAKLMWSTQKAVKVMLKAIEKRKKVYVFTTHGKVLVFLGKYFPALTRKMMEKSISEMK